jgi:LPS export ABC transporter protein LptC
MNLKPKKLRIILLSLIVGALGSIVTVFIGYRSVSNHPEKLLTGVQDGVGMSMGSIRHIATKDGRKEWRLEAESAHLNNSKNKLLLKNISLSFFMENGKEMYLSAKQGTLDTESNDIKVSGGVVLTNDKFKLTTRELNYTHSKRILVSSVPVKVVNSSNYVTADSMFYDLNKTRAEFKGNVKGLLDENFFRL